MLSKYLRRADQSRAGQSVPQFESHKISKPVKESFRDRWPTHPPNITPQHLDSYSVFQERANNAFKGAFPKSTPPRYVKTFVLLLRWEHDDLRVAPEISRLKEVFETCYRFGCETWNIPTSQAEDALVQKILQFKTSHAGKEHLLVVYYGGHAEKARHNHCIWRR